MMAGKPPVYMTFRGKQFEVAGDGWTDLGTAGRSEPAYEIVLAFNCCTLDIQLSHFEMEADHQVLAATEAAIRERALQRAASELYLIATQHEARCPQCQADIVQGLLRPRRQRQDPKPEDE